MTVLEGICAVICAATVSGLIIWAGYAIESNHLEELEKRFPSKESDEP